MEKSSRRRKEKLYGAGYLAMMTAVVCSFISGAKRMGPGWKSGILPMRRNCGAFYST